MFRRTPRCRSRPGWVNHRPSALSVRPAPPKHTWPPVRRRLAVGARPARVPHVHQGLGLPRPWNSPYIWGSVALILTYSAYVAEIFRAGIDSVHPSQRSAALSLGLSERQIMWDVILPQAVRNVVPSQMNMLIALQKDVSLLSFIGPVEIFRQAGVFKSLLANFTPYVGAAIIFLIITILATRYADYLLARQSRERS